MHLTYRNVNEAFKGLVEGIDDKSIYTVKTSSRVGDVLQIPEPVIITFQKPLERTLLNNSRDANCFLHVFESLWMLAGRRDIAPINHYSKQWTKQVDDGNEYANGAYGYRWRNQMFLEWNRKGRLGELVSHQIVDQLKVIADHLKAKPDSRRAVLQMWNVEDDLLKIDTSKDVCCNTAVYFSIRTKDRLGYIAHTGDDESTEYPPYKFLDMTVTNRSNDLIWGLLGANHVQFSFLQEYMAKLIGVEVGVYNQFTNNLHVYTERFKPKEWLEDDTRFKRNRRWVGERIPLVSNPDRFDKEVARFIDTDFSQIHEPFEEEFLQHVAAPMCRIFSQHLERDYIGAESHLTDILDHYWYTACYYWITRRSSTYYKKLEVAGD